MKLKLMSDTAKIPKKGSKGAAGYDLFADEAVVIPPGMSAMIKSGVSVEMPEDIHGFIWPRSKLATKKRIAVLAGVIDNDYRGEIHIALMNHGSVDLDVRVGDAIAQIVFQEVNNNVAWDLVADLPDTDRGSKGITCSEMRLKHDEP